MAESTKINLHLQTRVIVILILLLASSASFAQYNDPVYWANLFEASRQAGQANADITDQNKTYITTKVFDEDGKVLGEGRQYYDRLGRPTQNHSRKSTKRRVLVTQTLYDDYGREAVKTLPAPSKQDYLQFQDDFITNLNGENYSSMDFDRRKDLFFEDLQANDGWYKFIWYITNLNYGKSNFPVAVASDTYGTLGHYYSNNNVYESYTPTTGFPYSRVEYDDNNLGVIKKSSAPGDAFRMGQGHEVQTYNILSLNELDYLYGEEKSWIIDDYSDVNKDGQGTITPATLPPPNPIGGIGAVLTNKTISVDQNGQETVVFSSSDGKVLAKCLSGEKDGSNVNTWEVNYTQPGVGSTPSDKGFIDVHIPKGCENSLNVKNNWFSSNYLEISRFTVMNLETGKYLTFSGIHGKGTLMYAPQGSIYNGGQPPLEAGVYRITWVDGARQLNATGAWYGMEKFSFKITQDVNYYNFSLNYYDYAGRLKLTVPPAGVDTAYIPSDSLPDHKMIYSMVYNDANQVESSISPDVGFSEFLYRKDGQIRFSKNAKQTASNATINLQRYSYTNYDKWGRVIESGEYDPTLSGGSGVGWSNLDADTSTLDAARSTDRSYVMYDKGDITYSTYTQNHLLGKVAKIWNDNSTIWYSYDEQGRVTFTVRKIENMPTAGDSTFFTLNYIYDFNGNVTEVAFQKEDAADDYYYYYEYNSDNQLSKAFSSRDAGVSKSPLASYSYYIHGPLKRIELADQTQGLDYVYTINGWLKSINSPELDSRDPGNDGQGINANRPNKDLFGMSLDYFAYAPLNHLGTPANYLRPDYVKSNTYVQTYYGGESLFNGMIKAQRWQTVTDTNSTIKFQDSQLSYEYEYDEKYQITAANFAKVSVNGNINHGGGEANTALTLAVNTNNEYNLSGITYDLNDNITALKRNTFYTASDSDMDDLTYNYNLSSGRLLNNKLSFVSDGITTYDHPGLELKSGQVAFNYVYDEIGQQVTDYTHGYIAAKTTYDVSGRVTKIENINDANKYTTFVYDEAGRRLKKYNTGDGGATGKVTWYVRDAGGRVISTYDVVSGSNVQKEVNLYAASRVGKYDNETGKNLFELSDHLGNVRSTFTLDYKSAFSTGFDGEGVDDVYFTELNEPNGYIYKYHLDTVLTDNNGNPASNASVGIPAKRYGGGLAGPVDVKAGDTITGSIWTYIRADETPEPKLVFGSIPYGDTYWFWAGHPAIVHLPLDTVSATWTETDYSYVVIEDGEFHIAMIGNWSPADPNNTDSVWFDDFSIDFGTGGVARPEVNDFADYYPHGSVMPGRTHSTTLEYRYGYQGQFAEKDDDPETGFSSFELRNYDGIIGRWSSIDPFNQYHSPYNGMGNNPINGIDPDGGFFIVDDYIVGFIRGLFSNKDNFARGQNRLGYANSKGLVLAKNSAMIWGGLFAVDRNNGIAQGAAQIVSRLSYELIQTSIGFVSAHVANMVGNVEVKYAGGATGLRMLNSRGGWGLALGTYIFTDRKIKRGSNMFEHEYGHYRQSRFLGPLYLLPAAYSLLDASYNYNHRDMWFERGADKVSDNYFKKHR